MFDTKNQPDNISAAAKEQPVPAPAVVEEEIFCSAEFPQGCIEAEE